MAYKTDKIKELQNIILNEIDMLISTSPDKDNRSLGCYYVLIAFVETSNDKVEFSVPWLIQAT